MDINVLETQAPGQPADLLGKRIRRLRKARDRTLDSLAQQVGITKGYLSKVETGRQIPPLATLSKVAKALDTDLASLLEAGLRGGGEETAGGVSLVRAEERRPVIRGGSSFGYDYQSLVQNASGRHMSPFLFTFPKQILKEVFFEHAGEELIFVLSGTVEFTQTGTYANNIIAPGTAALQSDTGVVTTLTGLITNAGTLNFTGPGTFDLTTMGTTSTWNGVTTLNGGATVKINAVNQLGGTQVNLGDASGGATLQLDGGLDYTRALTLGIGGTNTITGYGTLSGKLTGSGGPSEDQQFPMRNGKVEGDKITFEVVAGEDRVFKLSFTAKGDTIEGEGTSPDGEVMALKLTRVKS